MPLIEFECEKCDIVFEKVFALRSDFKEGEVECPECASKEAVKRLFNAMTQAKFLLSKTKKINLIDKGYKLSKGQTPPGLKRLN
ncbi:MAG: Zinc ribbon domain protein [bacterium ADurb.Bin243]|nr:MAG: Zinc ribbon domain protein [bacterium ADurb.Bin243]HOD40286.1 zinc ribbon domain-containing protein [Candidatus Wallbacteria bacterium]